VPRRKRDERGDFFIEFDEFGVAEIAKYFFDVLGFESGGVILSQPS
jgi:hypothetical protein